MLKLESNGITVELHEQGMNIKAERTIRGGRAHGEISLDVETALVLLDLVIQHVRSHHS